MLKVLGVPFAGLIALFVAIADLIPLVGATLGAVVAASPAFVHSVPAGIVVDRLLRASTSSWRTTCCSR